MRKHIEKDGFRCTEHLHCIKCGKQLDPAKAIWLEWDTHLAGPSKEPIPEGRSQGCFPYGKDCAAALGFRNDSETLK